MDEFVDITDSIGSICAHLACMTLLVMLSL
ncbi:hypothetical protein ABIF14_005346 [Bradyrhizobium elkanii]